MKIDVDHVQLIAAYVVGAMTVWLLMVLILPRYVKCLRADVESELDRKEAEGANRN